MYGKHMNDMTSLATQVWDAGDLKDKKNLLRRMVASFKYKAKVREFTKLIDETEKPERLDKLAADLALNKTDKVVKLLPR